MNVANYRIKNIILVTILLAGFIFSGCIDLNNKSIEEKEFTKTISSYVNDPPLLVKIEKRYSSGFYSKADVSINITNTGNEDVDLKQFSYYIYKYDPNFKAYQERKLMILDPPVIGFMGNYKIGPEKTFLWSISCPKNEEKYRFDMKIEKEDIILKSRNDTDINIKNIELNKTSEDVLKMEFKISPEDWNEFNMSCGSAGI